MKYVSINMFGFIFMFVVVLFLTIGHTFAASNKDIVDVYVLPGCSSCHKAEEELYQAHIAFNEREFKASMVAAPTIYVNHKFYGIGTKAVEQYIEERRT